MLAPVIEEIFFRGYNGMAMMKPIMEYKTHVALNILPKPKSLSLIPLLDNEYNVMITAQSKPIS